MPPGWSHLNPQGPAPLQFEHKYFSVKTISCNGSKYIGISSDIEDAQIFVQSYLIIASIVSIEPFHGELLGLDSAAAAVMAMQ